MKLVKQNRFECSLAVCAMVSGAKYEAVQTYAWNMFPMQIGKGYRGEQVRDIWAEFDLPYITAEAYSAAPVVNLAKLTLKGRGHILYRNHKMLQWHHVAFESGMIYDGREDRPQRLASWAKTKAFYNVTSTICRVVLTHLKAANKGIK